MSKRGPRPTPTNLRILRGDHPERVNQNEPQPGAGLPEPPDDLPDEVRDVWDYTLEQLRVMCLATPADRDTLLAYCWAVVRHRQASRLLSKSGVLIKGRDQEVVRNPASIEQKHAAAEILRFAAEFGLTPSARSRIHTEQEKPKEKGAQRVLS